MKDKFLKPLLTILTVNYNTADFIGLMLYAFSKLTLNEYKLIICDNGSKNHDIKKLVTEARKYNNIDLIFRNQSKSGSIAHGEALDILIQKVDTKYTVIMDSDCTFLKKNWDEELIKRLDIETKIIGSTSPPNRSGLRRGGGRFPLPFAVLFDTEVFKNLGIRCIPGDITKGQDTCWEWESKFTSNGYKGRTFITKNTRDYKQGPFGHLSVIEELYLENQEIIASHFGRGSSIGQAKYFKRLKIPYFSKYIKRWYGNIEKKKWISKCNEIIDR